MGTYRQPDSLAGRWIRNAQMAAGFRLPDATISLDIPVIGFYRFIHRNTNCQLADNSSGNGGSGKKFTV